MSIMNTHEYKTMCTYIFKGIFKDEKPIPIMKLLINTSQNYS